MERLYENWEKVENKIINLARYWKLFNLSIGGRIMVAKTYLISQVTYLMGVLMVDNVVLNRLNTIILDFVKGQNRLIAQERWYLEAKYGGYGIVDLVKMNIYMKASWITKWAKTERDKDYVKERVMSGNYNNVSRIEHHQGGERNGFISGEIIGKWLEYKEMFFSSERNALQAHLFGNTGLIGIGQKVESLGWF
jgi:hypothetical protein